MPSPLRDRVAVLRSPVHGRGLFACVRLRKGARIGRFEGALTQRDGPHVLWVLEEDGSRYGIRGSNELRFLNHAARPNSEFQGDDLIAIHNIQPGCEIMIHYGDDWENVE